MMWRRNKTVVIELSSYDLASAWIEHRPDGMTPRS
jgi:hypothetical protein